MALALDSGLHWTHIGRIERGERDARITTVIRLATTIGVSPCRFFEPMPSD
jgi:hypothetical protein